MKTYHYSILFNGCDIRHHGEFYSAFSDEKQIVRKAKKEIEAKLPAWGFGGKDIVETEIYYIENDEERQVFNYKQNEV